MAHAVIDLSDKVVLVTGVSTGLGRRLAQILSEMGASVVGTARRADLGKILQAELTGRGQRFFFVEADLTVVAQCRRVVQETVGRFGRLDVLINNAAARSDPPLLALHDVDEANWDRVVDTNLKAPFFLTRFAYEPMRKAGAGLILNISSHTAEQATRGMAPYVASKAGLVQLTRATAVEYLDEGIRANVILLGGTDTGQFDRTAEAAAKTRMDPAVPSRRSRLYDPEHVARTIALLICDDAATVTGATIAIDHATTAGAMTSAFTHQGIARMARSQVP